MNPWRLQAWLGHKRIDETMLHVHVAEAHHRELPEIVREKARGIDDPIATGASVVDGGELEQPASQPRATQTRSLVAATPQSVPPNSAYEVAAIQAPGA